MASGYAVQVSRRCERSPHKMTIAQRPLVSTDHVYILAVMLTKRAPSAAIAGLVVVVIGACAATHQGRAQQYYSQGRLDEADYEIQQALTRDPNNLAIEHLAAQIFTQQGVAHYKRGEMIAAGNYLHRAIDYYPTYGPAYDYLGLIAF